MPQRPSPARRLRRSAIVFDLDGTLIDTAPDLAAALNAVLARRGRAAISVATFRAIVGDGARAMVARGLQGADGPPAEADIAAAMAEFLAHYSAHIADGSRPFPGVVDALAALRAQGCVFGVCTNKQEKFSVQLLRELGLHHYFAAVVGGDSLSVRKPDPAHLLATIERMGAAPTTAVMVGDSAADVDVARAAGVPVIAVSFGYTATPAAHLGADRLLHHFSELPELVAGLA